MTEKINLGKVDLNRLKVDLRKILRWLGSD